MIRRQRRKSTWIIVEDSHGTYSVWRGNRAWLTGLNSVEVAEGLIRKNRQVHERVWLAEPDGYRTDITKNFEKTPQRSRR